MNTLMIVVIGILIAFAVIALVKFMAAIIIVVSCRLKNERYYRRGKR